MDLFKAIFGGIGLLLGIAAAYVAYLLVLWLSQPGAFL